MILLARLALRPRTGAREVLDRGTLPVAGVAILATCAVTAMNASRFAAMTRFQDLAFGPERLGLVDLLVSTIGVPRTAVVLVLVEQAWAAILVLSALSPLLVWLLGTTAVHAAARLAEVGRAFHGFFVFFGYAAAATLLPAALLANVLEADAGSPLVVASRLAGTALSLWLGYIAYRGIEAYYAVSPTRALTILVVAVTLFYLVPLFLMATALVAIVTAAILLELA